MTGVIDLYLITPLGYDLPPGTMEEFNISSPSTSSNTSNNSNEHSPLSQVASTSSSSIPLTSVSLPIASSSTTLQQQKSNIITAADNATAAKTTFCTPAHQQVRTLRLPIRAAQPEPIIDPSSTFATPTTSSNGAITSPRNVVRDFDTPVKNNIREKKEFVMAVAKGSSPEKVMYELKKLMPHGSGYAMITKVMDAQEQWKHMKRLRKRQRILKKLQKLKEREEKMEGKEKEIIFKKPMK